MTIQNVTSSNVPQAGIPPITPPRVQHISYEALQTLFDNPHRLGTDDYGSIDHSNGKNGLKSFEIGDCITVFALRLDNAGNVDEIFGYHASVGTTEQELIDLFNEYVLDQGNTFFF